MFSSANYENRLRNSIRSAVDLLGSLVLTQLHRLHREEQKMIDNSVEVVLIFLGGDPKVPLEHAQELFFKLVQFLQRDAAYARDEVVPVEDVVEEL